MKKSLFLLSTTCILAMYSLVKAQTIPTLNATPEQFQAFSQFPDDQTLLMVNFIKFKEKVEGRDISGRELYNQYVEESTGFAEKVGAEVVWYGKPLYVVVGPPQQILWDAMFVIKFPDKMKFFAMGQMPGFPHDKRVQSLSDSRLIACSPDDNFFLTK